MIYFVFVVVFLLILTYWTLKIHKRNKEELTSQGLSPNYEKYNTNLTTIANDPTGDPLDFDPKKKYYNHTQLYYAFLVQLFQTLSANKQTYDTVLVEDHPKDTLDQYTKERINYLVIPVLEKVKSVAPMSDLYLVGAESFTVHQVKDSPVRINKIDCFVYDRMQWVQLRLLLEIAEIPQPSRKKQGEKTCGACTTPDFPTYPIGYPAMNQLIPLPTQVIVTGKDVLSGKGIDYPTPPLYEKIWINNVQIVNSNLVLNAFEPFKGPQLPGENKIPYDYTVWKGGNNPYLQPARIRNKWPTLNSQPKNLKAWPCTPVPEYWNLYGITPEVHPTKNCPGVRSSLTEQPLTASYDPSMFNNPRNDNSYDWLFRLSKSIPGMPFANPSQ